MAEGIWYDITLVGVREVEGDLASSPPQAHVRPSGKPRRSPERLLSCVHVWQCGTVSTNREPTPFAGGVFSSAETGVRVTLTEYADQRVRVRPDLLKLEPFILEYLTDVQKRDGSDATLVNAKFAFNQLFFNLDIDNVPKLHRFKEKDCQLIEGTKP
jgi:hypothetical protein